jgi:shikimate kinase
MMLLSQVHVHLKLKRTPGLYLTGFMGAGKTTVGRILSEKLGWDFVDLDNRVEAREGMPVAAIFAERGEEAFRRVETAALQEVMEGIERGNPTVVALGGGTFPQTVNYDLIATAGISVWLDCGFGTVASRVAADGARPLAADPDAFRNLYESRRNEYSRADFRVDAEAGAEDVVSRILCLPIWK